MKISLDSLFSLRFQFQNYECKVIHTFYVNIFLSSFCLDTAGICRGTSLYAYLMHFVDSATLFILFVFFFVWGLGILRIRSHAWSHWNSLSEKWIDFFIGYFFLLLYLFLLELCPLIKWLIHFNYFKLRSILNLNFFLRNRLSNFQFDFKTGFFKLKIMWYLINPFQMTQVQHLVQQVSFKTKKFLLNIYGNGVLLDCFFNVTSKLNVAMLLILCIGIILEAGVHFSL